MNPYDEENKDDKYGQYTPEEIRNLEQEYSTRQDEKEDKNIEAGASPKDQERGGTGRDLRLRSQKAEAEEAEALQSKLEAGLAGVRDTLSLSLYSPTGDNPTGKKKKFGLAAGGGILALLLTFGSLFGFLNVFKLDHLMQNIEAKTFIRMQVDMDGRSSKWIAAYLTIRMGEVEDPKLEPQDRKNVLFRADRVDNNKPLTDWYRTMRTSKFEADLFEKQGIKFTSNFGPDGKFRPAKITIDDRPIELNLSQAEIEAIENGDVNSYNGRLREFIDEDVMGSDKQARREIKKAVNENTHAWQVIKRRQIRQDIQNMTGVRSWRFFEKTRDKVGEKTIDVRNKIIVKSLPADTTSGKFIQCLFGITDCRASTDPRNPVNQSGAVPQTGECKKGDGVECGTIPDENADPDNPSDPQNNNGAVEEAVAEATAPSLDTKDEVEVPNLQVAIVKKIVEKLNVATSLISIIDTLDTVDKTISDGSISKMVYMARASQAVGLFTTYSIARDQLKTGEATNKEVSALMETVGNVSNSEGWSSVIDTSANKASAEGFTAAKNKAEYCKPDHQAAISNPNNKKEAEKEYHWLCPNEKIGGDTLAKDIEDGYKSTIGIIISPIAQAYRETAGRVIKPLIAGFGDLISKVTGPIIQGTISALGLKNVVEDLTGWIISQVASFLGAGPTLDPQAPSGRYGNHIIAGGAAAQSIALRGAGAASTNPETKAATIQLVDSYNTDTNRSQNLYKKYLDINNHRSFAATSSFNVATTLTSKTSVLDGIKALISSVPNIYGTMFNKKALASNSPYAADTFAGVDSYDFPSTCINQSPLVMTPQSATNADDLGLISPGELTWDLVNSKDQFYQKLWTSVDAKYKNDTDTGDIVAKSVYNCALLDTEVRGGIGALYGYSDDGGLGE